MGKRKRSGTSFHPSSSDSRPCSSGRDLTPGESNSSAPDNGNIFKSHPSVKETMDTRGKQPSSQLSLGQHQHNLSRSMFWKRSRHHYGNQYSRRNSPNYHKPSSSYGKSSPFPDERLCFTLGSKYNSDIGHRPDFAEFRESTFWRPERIRSSTSVIQAISPDAVKMTCGVCQKSLRRKPSEELSIAAVLVCGHIFHAECLEQRTQVEDKRDPPCPICSGFDPQIELIDLERDS